MRVVLAVLVSIAAHALLAAALAWCLSERPTHDTDAMLGLAHIEISFAEAEDMSAMPSQQPPSAAETAAATLPDLLPSPVSADETDFAMPKIAPVEISRVQPVSVRPPMEMPSAASETVAPSAPRQAEVVAPPALRRPLRPDYPRGARHRGEEGDVVLEIGVESDGSVGEVRVVESSGWNELDASALKAAKAASFSPARAGGRAIGQKVRLRLSFKLK